MKRDTTRKKRYGKEKPMKLPSSPRTVLGLAVLYGTPPALHTRTVVVTLYCELRPYEESAKGTWGVSPDFTMSLPDYD